MNRDFACPSCGNTWGAKSDEDGLYDGYTNAPCPICGTPGTNPNDYGDFVCPYCNYNWRKYGNGGLVFGCWPTCPKCGTMADEA
jgi:hypothetical protein